MTLIKAIWKIQLIQCNWIVLKGVYELAKFEMRENLRKFLDAAEYSKQTIVKSDISFNENKHSLKGFV